MDILKRTILCKQLLLLFLFLSSFKIRSLIAGRVESLPTSNSETNI